MRVGILRAYGEVMQDKKHSVLKPLEIDSARVKARYVSPKLRTYGAVNQLTGGGGESGGDSMSMRAMSDRTLKENIVRVGIHPLGIGLYLFNYKPEYRESSGFGRRFGVMADELQAVLPQAVVMHPNGYKMVDYAMLGIDIADQTAH